MDKPDFRTMQDASAIQFMVLDMLGNLLAFSESPSRIGGFLTQQIRELVGARVVVLIQYLRAQDGPSHKVVALQPERHAHAPWVATLGGMLPAAKALPGGTLWNADGSPPEVARFLSEAGLQSVIAIPLTLAGEPTGALLALDLLDMDRNEDVLRSLELLGPVVSLVLRNASDYESLESLVEARTRDLARSEQGFRSLAQVAPVGIFRLGPDGGLTFANNRLWQISGFAAFEGGAWDFAKMIHPEDQDRTWKDWRAMLEQKREFQCEFRLVRRDGSIVWILAQAVGEWDPEGALLGITGTFTDATARKLAEAEAERWRQTFHLAGLPLAHIDHASARIIQVNRAFAQDRGYEPEEMAGMPLAGIVAPEGLREAQEITARLERDAHQVFESVHLRRDGSRFPTLVDLTVVRGMDGMPSARIAYALDQTNLKRAEGYQRELTRILDSSLNEIYVFDAGGLQFRYVNRGALLNLGYTMEAMARMTAVDIKPDFTEASFREAIAPLVRGEREALNYVTRHRRADGTTYPAEVRLQLTELSGEQVFLAIILDITQRRQDEEDKARLQIQLLQAQKMESLGALAGGVAHDINNVLAAIQAITQTLRFTHGGDGALVEALETLEKATNRGRDMVKGLTNFTRKGLREPQNLDLHHLIQEEVEILRRTTLQKIQLVLELHATSPIVRGEPASLASMLMNLCVNALDAMPEGGTLTLGTRCMTEGQVELTVRDSGHGMPKEVLARALEPFFSTKPVGKGTGLGLAMAYTTIKAHGGALAIQSEPGMGTTIIIRLPTLSGQAALEPPPENAPPASPALRILQVDDDELILASVPSMIRTLGHEVATAAGGRNALEMLRAGLKVDLLILDLNMPGMNGEETLRALRATHPRLPVLLATGFLDARTEAILGEDPMVRIIAKPFSLSELRSKLREASAPGARA